MLDIVLKDNVMPFPSVQLATDYGRQPRFAPQRLPEPNSRLPIGICLLAWAGMASVGWCVVGLAIHLI
jgi:hypothetical protein